MDFNQPVRKFERECKKEKDYRMRNKLILAGLLISAVLVISIGALFVGSFGYPALVKYADSKIPDRILAQEQMDAVRIFYARSEGDTLLFWDEIPYTFPIGVTGEIPYPGTGGGEATARAYFEEFKGLYRLTNPAKELAIGEITQDEEGRTHVDFDQRHQGVPVYGASANVHLKGEKVLGVSARLLPNLSLNITPTITVNEAKEAVLREHHEFVIEETSLVIFNIGAITNREAETNLAWLIRAADATLVEAYEYFVDARTGSILFSVSLVVTE